MLSRNLCFIPLVLVINILFNLKSCSVDGQVIDDDRIFCDDNARYYCGDGHRCCTSTLCCPNNRVCCWSLGTTRCCKDPTPFLSLTKMLKSEKSQQPRTTLQGPTDKLF